MSDSEPSDADRARNAEYARTFRAREKERKAAAGELGPNARVPFEPDHDFSELRNYAVAELCSDLPDARMYPVLVALSAGKSHKEAAAIAGVHYQTVWRWCREYPLVQMAAHEARERGKHALLKLAAKMEDAACVVADGVDGKIKNKLQLDAAKFTLQALRDMPQAPANSQRALPADASAEQDRSREAAERLRKR